MAMVQKFTNKNHSVGGNAFSLGQGIQGYGIQGKARMKNSHMECYNTLAQDIGRCRLCIHMRENGEQVETLWDQGRQSDR